MERSPGNINELKKKKQKDTQNIIPMWGGKSFKNDPI